jgi:peptidoglycan/xylan/chitin deacetylase (PgdA/CDA1 family)
MRRFPQIFHPTSGSTLRIWKIVVLAVLALVLVLTSCQSEPEESNLVTIIIGPDLVDCVGVAPQKCMQVKNQVNEDWTLFYDQIQGFEYEEGFEYILVVEMMVVENPPADGSSLVPKLVRIVEKEPVSETGAAEEEQSASNGRPIQPEIENLGYPLGSLGNEKFTLQSGAWRREAAVADPDIQVQSIELGPYRAYGELDEDSSRDGAVILVVTDENGTKHYELSAVLNRQDGLQALPSVLLGERIHVRDLRIEKGALVIQVDSFTESDPACCPSTSSEYRYRVVNGDLVQESETELQAPEMRTVLSEPPRRLRYTPGKRLSAVEGELSFNQIDRFIRLGLAGQLMEVSIDSPDSNVVLSISGSSDGSVLVSAAERLIEWSGELTSTQDYIIRAVAIGPDTGYVLNINTSGEGGRRRMIPPEPYFKPLGDGIIYARRGPGLGYEIAGILETGEAIHITGKNLGVTAETRWWRVCCFDGQEGWVRDDSGQVIGSTEGLSISEVPSEVTPEPIVAEIPPENGTDDFVYLTFNEGQDPDWTNQVLEILSIYDVPATFFASGKNMRLYPDVLERQINQEHQVASLAVYAHSQTDQDREVLLEDLRFASSNLSEQDRLCVRPGVSTLDPVTMAVLEEQGYKVFMWDLNSNDYLNPGVVEITEQVLAKVKPGSHILFHDGGEDREQTIEALPQILEELIDRGYQFARTCNTGSETE